MNLVNNGIIQIPKPVNEPIYDYAPGSAERQQLENALKATAANSLEIPLIIGGQEVTTGELGHVVMPHDHKHILATYHKAGVKEVQSAIDAAVAAQKQWHAMRWEERCAIFLKASN